MCAVNPCTQNILQFFQIEMSKVKFNLNNIKYNWYQPANIYLAPSVYQSLQ